jgi:hypothetical protein
MVRKIGLVLVVMTVVLTAFVVSAQKETDSSEAPPSDVIGVIDILADGDVIESAFTATETAHLYAFNAASGDTLTLGMTQAADSTLDPFLVVVGPSGQVVASDDDSGPEPFLSSLISDVTLPEDGSYFVLATSFIHIDNILVENEVEGVTEQEVGESYTLTISGITAPTSVEDFDPELISFFGTSMTIGDTVEGESTLEFPVGFYVFAGTAGQAVDITAEGVDSFDTIIHVFSPAGERIGVNDDDSGTLNSAVRGLELPYDGLYMVWVTNPFFYNAGVKDSTLEYDEGAYSVSVQ